MEKLKAILTEKIDWEKTRIYKGLWDRVNKELTIKEVWIYDLATKEIKKWKVEPYIRKVEKPDIYKPAEQFNDTELTNHYIIEELEK